MLMNFAAAQRVALFPLRKKSAKNACVKQNMLLIFDSNNSNFFKKAPMSGNLHLEKCLYSI